MQQFIGSFRSSSMDSKLENLINLYTTRKTPWPCPTETLQFTNAAESDLQELRGLPSSMALGRNGTEVERRNFRRFLYTIIRSSSFQASISHGCIAEVSVMRG